MAEKDPLTENTLCFIDAINERNGEVESQFYEGADHGFDTETTGADGIANTTARQYTIEWLRKYLDF